MDFFPPKSLNTGVASFQGSWLEGVQCIPLDRIRLNALIFENTEMEIFCLLFFGKRPVTQNNYE